MSMKFTKVPVDTWKTIQLNAGILVDQFTPATGAIGNILGATSGGVNFNSNPTYVDFGDDVDNVPANTKELKKLQGFDPAMSGTLITCTAAGVKRLLAAADIDTNDTTKVIPRAVLKTTDFHEVWWIGDYSDENEDESAGFIAIHMKDSLNTTGFQIQSSKNGKGTMPFEFHGHYTLEDLELNPPFEIYVKAGEAE